MPVCIYNYVNDTIDGISCSNVLTYIHSIYGNRNMYLKRKLLGSRLIYAILVYNCARIGDICTYMHSYIYFCIYSFITESTGLETFGLNWFQFYIQVVLSILFLLKLVYPNLDHVNSYGQIVIIMNRSYNASSFILKLF